MVPRWEIGSSLIPKPQCPQRRLTQVRELAVAVVLEELNVSSKRCSCVVTCEEEANGEYTED